MHPKPTHYPAATFWQPSLAKLALTVLLAAPFGLQGAKIIQGSGTSFIAFEAESTAALVAGTPENWKVVADAAASGGSALIADGTNSTGDSPHSFAQFQLNFSTAGTYYIYYRWRTDPARTAGDAFTANSSWLANRFGAFSTPGAAAQADYIRTDSNNLNAPENNVYTWRRDLETTVYTVGAPELAAPQILTLGTREAGMSFDRFVLSTDPSLTPAALDALSNSETDVVVQGAGESFLAWEAEVKAKLIAGTPENWKVVADAAASGGSALIADGTNSTGDSPHSFAQFQLNFSTAGTYYIYYRWRTDPARTAGDAFTANSSWLANRFGAFSTPGAAAQADYIRTDSNNLNAPENNVYTWRRDLETTVYTVGAPELAAPQILTLGTREAGMSFDRFVLSTDPSLTPAALDALVNSGTKPPTPDVKSAVGSATLNTVTLTFTRPLQGSTVVPGNFSLGPVNVTGASLDTEDARIVHLTTGTQTEGTVYNAAVTGVKDTAGTTVAPGTKGTFTAWKRVNGWATKEIYFSITGTTVADLTGAASYLAHQPSRVEYVKGFQLNQAPLTDNYGARLSAFFSPNASEAYNLFLNNDDEAELFLSSDSSEANLASLGLFPLTAAFDDAVFGATAPLTAGQRYLLVGLLKQGTGDVYLNVGARRASGTTPAAQVPVLSGDRISTFVNPDLGKVTFTRQPASVTAPASRRATFRVAAETLTQPVYYQWQLNGADIPGATRTAYTTPVLAAGDSGKKYRCIVSVAGIDTPSNEATLTVGASDPSPQQPYVGINFVGGGTSGGGTLTPVDVAGVVAQENWNNLTGFAFDTAALVDAAGAASAMTLSGALGTEVWYTGTSANGDADGLLLQGFVSAGASKQPVTFTLNNVPTGTYQLLAYSVGFDFAAAYEEAFSLVGAATYPTYHVRAETGLPYKQNPGYRRMISTRADGRDTGNYVQFDNVSPAPDGSLTLSVTWESAAEGNGHQPALNALQLVKVVPVVQPLVITSVARDGGDIVVTWTGGTGTFEVQGKLGLTDPNWLVLKTTTERSFRVPVTVPMSFVRIVDGSSKTVKMFRATLNAAQEVSTPAVNSPATGAGLLILDGTTATYLIGYENLVGTLTASHLHGPAAAGANAGVKLGFVATTGTQSGVINGQGTLDAATISALEAGNTYFNIHTTAYGGGEIRGQVQLVP